MLDPVALVRYKGCIKESLREAIEAIGGFGKLKSPFIIKPNICTEADSTGIANTSVEFIEALIELVLNEDEDLSIKIVESDSFSKFADEAFEKFGYKRLEKRLKGQGFDVGIINLSNPPLQKINIEGLYFNDIELHEVLIDPGYFTTVAVAKTHGLTLITGALKNQFGLLPKKDQNFYHPYINDVIVDLNRVVRSDLCIVDATMGLEGVITGRPRRVNAIIVGRNPASVDAVMARVMGFKPERIRHIVEAERFNLGKLNPVVMGEDIESITVKFKRPSSLKPSAIIE